MRFEKLDYFRNGATQRKTCRDKTEGTSGPLNNAPSHVTFQRRSAPGPQNSLNVFLTFKKYRLLNRSILTVQKLKYFKLKIRNDGAATLPLG